MVDSNNPPPGGTAELIENSSSQEDHEIEDKVGAAIADSLEEEEQSEEQQTKPAEGETTEKESNEEAEEEGSDKTEDEPEEEPEKPATVKLPDGSEVTLDEAVKGYMRQSDYTRKTQEVAKNNRELEAAAQRLIQQDQAFKRDAAFLESALQELLPKPPDPQLLSTDPVGFLQQKEAHERAIQKLQRARQLSQGVDSRLQDTQRAQTQEERNAQLAALTEKLPSLRTEQGRNAFFQEATEIAGKAWGFTPEEIGAFTDHRYILALRDAVEYRKLQGKKMEAVRKAKEAPPMKPATRQAPNARAEQSRKNAWDTLRQEQSEEAAAAALPDHLFT